MRTTKQILLSVTALGLVTAATLTISLREGPYRATEQDLIYSVKNDYMLYFMAGSDTLGQPISTQLTEVHAFSPTESGFDLSVRLKGDEFAAESSFGIGFDGRVKTIDGRAVDEISSPRLDVLPRIPFPAESLRAGVSWVDSVTAADSSAYGERKWYRVVRDYHVVGEVELRGRTVVLIVSEGGASIRQGGPHPDMRKNAWWQEVNGAVVDSVWFDVVSGILVQDATRMSLAGAGQLFLSDVCCDRSGLVSSSRRTLSE